MSISTEEIFHAVQKKNPANVCIPRFSCHSGVKSIVLPFKVAAASGPKIHLGASSSDHTPTSLPSLPSMPQPLLLNNRETQVLVMLTLEGRSPEVVHEFEKVIEKMPARFQIKIIDGFEKSNGSAGVFVCMIWEAFAQLLSTVDMEPLLPAVGPSLIASRGPSSFRKRESAA